MHARCSHHHPGDGDRKRKQGSPIIVMFFSYDCAKKSLFAQNLQQLQLLIVKYDASSSAGSFFLYLRMMRFTAFRIRK